MSEIFLFRLNKPEPVPPTCLTLLHSSRRLAATTFYFRRSHSMLSGMTLVLFAALAPQAPCEALKTLTLPNTTITAAEFVPAAAAPAAGRGGRGGGAPLPAHCRVTAVLAPSSDSHIEME